MSEDDYAQERSIRPALLKKEFNASLEEDKVEGGADFFNIRIIDSNSLIGKMQFFERKYTPEGIRRILGNGKTSPNYKKIPKDVMFFLNLAYYQKVETFFDKKKSDYLSAIQQSHVLTKTALIYSLSSLLFAKYIQKSNKPEHTINRCRGIDPLVDLIDSYSIMSRHHSGLSAIYEVPEEEIMSKQIREKFMNFAGPIREIFPSRHISRLRSNPDLLTKNYLTRAMVFKLFKDILDKTNSVDGNEKFLSRKTDIVIESLVSVIDKEYAGNPNSTGLKHFFFKVANNSFMPENIYTFFQEVRNVWDVDPRGRKSKKRFGARHLPPRAKKPKISEEKQNIYFMLKDLAENPTKRKPGQKIPKTKKELCDMLRKDGPLSYTTTERLYLEEKFGLEN